jgi:hypothetical protein
LDGAAVRLCHGWVKAKRRFGFFQRFLYVFKHKGVSFIKVVASS